MKNLGAPIDVEAENINTITPSPPYLNAQGMLREGMDRNSDTDDGIGLEDDSLDDNNAFIFTDEEGKYRSCLLYSMDDGTYIYICLSFTCHYTGSKMCAFNKKHPLWVCCNAMNIEYKCTYVKCSQCYKSPLKHGQSIKVKKGKCSHKLLQPFEDKKIFC